MRFVRERSADDDAREQSRKSEERRKNPKMAGRQGFEPRYRGPEAAEETSVNLGFVGFVRKTCATFVPSRVETALSPCKVSRIFQVSPRRLAGCASATAGAS